MENTNTKPAPEPVITYVGGIQSYYGGIMIQRGAGKFMWGLESHSSDDWEEIPEELYVALLKYEALRRVENPVDDPHKEASGDMFTDASNPVTHYTCRAPDDLTRFGC